MIRSSFILFLVLVLVGCRTPQRMVEKAIKKDANVLSMYQDTITLTRVQIDSIPIIKNDTIIWEKVLTEVKFDTIIPIKLLEIERSKSRYEIRKNLQLEKRLIKMRKALAKDSVKLMELQAKLDAKTDRVIVRNETKQERSRNRWWLWFILGGATAIILRWLLNRRVNFKF